MSTLYEELSDILNKLSVALKPASAYASIVVNELDDALSRIFQRIEEHHAPSEPDSSLSVDTMPAGSDVQHPVDSLAHEGYPVDHQ